MDQLNLFGGVDILEVSAPRSRQLDLFPASVYLGKTTKKRQTAPIVGQSVWYEGRVGQIEGRFFEDLEDGREFWFLYIRFEDGVTDTALEDEVTLL